MMICSEQTTRDGAVIGSDTGAQEEQILRARYAGVVPKQSSAKTSRSSRELDQNLVARRTFID